MSDLGPGLEDYDKLSRRLRELVDTQAIRTGWKFSDDGTIDQLCDEVDRLRSLSNAAEVECPACEGSGEIEIVGEPHLSEDDCDVCGGSGVLYRIRPASNEGEE